MAVNYSGSGPGGAIQSGIDKWTPAKGELVRQDLVSLDADRTAHGLRLDTIESLTKTVTITSAEIKALRATPKTLVAAPGTGLLVTLAEIVLILDSATVAYVESSANLSVRYGTTTGPKASDDIETTGFIDQTSDIMITGRPKADMLGLKSAVENQPLVLHNLGAAEYTTGNGVIYAKVSYRVYTTGWAGYSLSPAAKAFVLLGHAPTIVVA